MLFFLRNIVKKIEINTPRQYSSYQINKQNNYLNKLKEPLNDIERSYNQYLCGKYLSKKIIYLIYDIFSFVIIIPFILVLLFRKNKYTSFNNDKYVYIDPDMGMSIIPNSLLKEINNQIISVSFSQKLSLKFEDLKLIKIIFLKYFYAPYFVFKCIIKIGLYRSIIQKYKPKAIIVASEYSFACTIGTLFCENNNVEHINIMHGNKLFFIRDSFFRFNRCYVWDIHYKQLFILLRAFSKQFIVEKPNSLFIDVDKYRNISKVVNYKYYMTSQSNNDIQIIKNLINIFNSKGESILIRPHPRYTDLNFLYKNIDSAFIEENDMSIEESISNCNYVIGGTSTVLEQAYYCGRIIILDDIIFKDKINSINELKYILCSKESVFYLSSFIKSNFNLYD